LPNRSWDSTVWVGDSRKLTAELGWQPRCSISDGLDRLAAWLRTDPQRRSRYEAAIERAQQSRAA
jgi:nucleoside-diphosphate-sugar epimerase